MTSVRLPPDYVATLQRTSARFRHERRAQGLTQEELAARAGVHRNTIQNLEADRFARAPAFRIDVMLAVAHALGLRGCDIFPREG